MPQHHEYPRLLSITLAMLVLLFLEQDVFVPVFGVTPSLALPFVVAVGITEGPYMGGGFGAAAGLLLDHGIAAGYGFSALLFMILGIAAGLLIDYFRLSVPTCAVFTAAAAFVGFTLRWFFFWYLWHGTGLFFRVVPLQLLFATLLSAPVFLLVRFLSRRFGSLKRILD